MRKPLLLCLSVCIAHLPFAQSSLQTSLLAGVSVPLHNNAVNGTNNGSGIHFGSSLDYLTGNGALRFGIGTYIGFLDALGTDVNYKQAGQAIASKYGLSPQGLVYNASPFKSTHILLGPVASVKTTGLTIDLWAKGGYGINEPGRYSVTYKEGNLTNNIYVSQAGENRNGLTYSLGGGVSYGLTANVGLQLAADYFTTATDQVIYNFEREKGLSPLYTRSNNAYIQASAGLVFTIGGTAEKDPQGRKGRRNKAQEAYANKTSHGATGQSVEESIQGLDAASKDAAKSVTYGQGSGGKKDTLLFVPEKLVIKGTRQTQSPTFGERTVQPLSSVNNYLTGFVYRGNNGTGIGQCGASEMPGDPVPGIDVKFLSETGSAPLQGRTNADGSFALNNIPSGNYRAVIGRDTLAVGVNDAAVNPGYSVLDLPVNECTSANNVVMSDNKLFVEILAAREVNTGMSTGRRIASLSSDPLPVTNRSFEINWNNIITSDGRLYAEVTGSREAGSGMASGRRMVLTGDVDGDGIPDYAVPADREHGTGMATGRSFVSGPRDIATGQASGRILAPRDISTGQASGYVLAPRDHASGQASGRIILLETTIEGDDDGESGGDTYILHLHKEGIVHRDLAARGVGNNPLYQGGGSSGNNPLNEPKGNLRTTGSKGENPLFEPKNDLRVAGSNGVEHALLLPSFTDLKTVSTNNLVPGASFECISNGSGGSVGSSVQKASINTTRSNIKHPSRISCMDGSCSVRCIAEVNGVEYEAVVTGKFKKG